MNKEIELNKHSATIMHLKKKLASQIVNKTLKITDIKQLTMQDVFQHAGEMEQDKHDRRKKVLAIYGTANEFEKDILMEKLWNSQVEKNIMG